ncbi:MAG: hypothetical protein ABWY49_08885 [Rhizobium sp.]
MSRRFSRFFSLFETARQIESAVRAAEEFERVRGGRDLCSEDEERASTGVPF